MPTYHFQEVSYKTSRNLKCACGKRFRRTRTFTNTINPFNKNPDTGLPRTYPEVYANVKAEAEAWQPDTTCGACEAAEHAAKVASGETVRTGYRVPAYLNGRVVVDGKPGTIVAFDDEGVYLRVLFDGETEPVKVHPRGRTEYVTEAEAQR